MQIDISDKEALSSLTGANSYNIRGVGGIMVSIAAFQAVDPGSIPGRRSTFFNLNQQMLIKTQEKKTMLTAL